MNSIPATYARLNAAVQRPTSFLSGFMNVPEVVVPTPHRPRRDSGSSQLLEVFFFGAGMDFGDVFVELRFQLFQPTELLFAAQVKQKLDVDLLAI